MLNNGSGFPVQKTVTYDLPQEYYCGDPAGPARETEEGESFLSDYLWLIGRHKWKIAAFVIVVTIATAYVSTRLTPIYQSTATIELDRAVPAGIVGQESQMPVGGNDTDQFLATQMKLIQAPSVLRRVVKKYDPERVPGMSAMDTVPEDERPIGLRNLTVTRPGNTYIMQISYRHKDPRMAANVANAVAQAYVEHTYEIRFDALAGLSKFMEKQLGALRLRMEQSSAALADFERTFQIIDPEEKTSIVSARLLQLNTQYTEAQGERVRKETAYNSVKSGSMDAIFVSSQKDEIKTLQDRLNEAEQKFVQIKIQLGVNHPDYRQSASLVAELRNQIDRLSKSAVVRAEVEYQESLAREQMIQRVLQDTRDEFDKLNAHSFRYKALKQDAEGDKKLYDELVHKIQESSINSGFQNSAIRLADPAVPSPRPVYPNVPVNLVMAFLLSTSFAMGVVLVSDIFDNTVYNPAHVKRMGSHVIGSLPSVRVRKADDHLVALSETMNVAGVGRASFRNTDQKRLEFGEAMRSIRESILLSDRDQPLRTLLVTSAAPREGKSTFATHLALANAMQCNSTLLIDADLRHPSAHVSLGMDNNAGLAQVIRTRENWKHLLQQVPGVPSLEFLSAGSPSNHMFDLLGATLKNILEEAIQKYDLIVIDSPPLLGLAEPLRAASLTDGVVVLAQANVTPRKALQAVMTALARVNARVIGVVLNQVDEQTSKKYYYHGNYER